MDSNEFGLAVFQIAWYLGPIFWGLLLTTCIALLIALVSALRQPRDLDIPLRRHKIKLFAFAVFGVVLSGPLFLGMFLLNLEPRKYGAAPKESIDIVRNLEKLLPKGALVFIAPNRLEISSSTSVSIILSTTKTAEELLKDALNLKGSPVQDATSIRVSNRMKATLQGDQFEIIPLSPDVQAIGGEKSTKWLWTITPKQEGNHILNATVAALVDINGKETPLVVQTYEKEITVNVTTGYQIKKFAEKNWQWLWTTLFVPLIAYIWKNRKPIS